MSTPSRIQHATPISIAVRIRNEREEVHIPSLDAKKLAAESELFRIVMSDVESPHDEIVVQEADPNTARDFLFAIDKDFSIDSTSSSPHILSQSAFPWNKAWAELAVRWGMGRFAKHYALLGEQHVRSMLVTPPRDFFSYRMSGWDTEDFNGCYDLIYTEEGDLDASSDGDSALDSAQGGGAAFINRSKRFYKHRWNDGLSLICAHCRQASTDADADAGASGGGAVEEGPVPAAAEVSRPKWLLSDDRAAEGDGGIICYYAWAGDSNTVSGWHPITGYTPQLDAELDRVIPVGSILRFWEVIEAMFTHAVLRRGPIETVRDLSATLVGLQGLCIPEVMHIAEGVLGVHSPLLQHWKQQGDDDEAVSMDF